MDGRPLGGGNGNGNGKGERKRKKKDPLYLASLHVCNIFSPHAIVVPQGVE